MKYIHVCSYLLNEWQPLHSQRFVSMCGEYLGREEENTRDLEMVT